MVATVNISVMNISVSWERFIFILMKLYMKLFLYALSYLYVRTNTKTMFFTRARRVF